jgi:hypothetical protein
MSTTTLKALDDICSAGARKLPAAPDTSTSSGPWQPRPAPAPRHRLLIAHIGHHAKGLRPSVARAASTLACLRLATETLAPAIA